MRVDDLLGNLLAVLWRWLRAVADKICCCCGRKVASQSETRLIEVGSVNSNSKKKHNKIKTSKYTLLMFLPKNLAEQFRRVVNFYFLIVTVIAIVIDSPVSPMTSIAPLTFMVLVTAVKQGYEDWLRHVADDKVNNQIVEIVERDVVKQVKNSSISAGTLVRVRRGREVPADLVLLAASPDTSRAYVTTANLDGETNLKTLRVPPPLVSYTPDILPQNMSIEVAQPVADLYTFYGRLLIPGLDSTPLSPDNLMLRGSRLKNTEWAIGCAVYTGEETKLALNSKYAGNKFSSCESAVNGFLVFFISLMVAEIIFSLACKIFIEKNNREREIYLSGEMSEYAPDLGSILQDLFSFLLLYYYIIPMSLYVTIEMYKFIGALFIGWDEELRCSETGRPAVANTSDLNEELGQVEVLFSDKTGTLTKNLMVFKTCSVRGRIYEERDSSLYHVEGFETPVDMTQTDIKFFFTILALCHSVQISSEDMKKLSARLSLADDKQLMNLFRRKKVKAANTEGVVEPGAKANGTTMLTSNAWNNTMTAFGANIDYQGSSPDEKALVEAASRLGVTFLGEEGNKLIVKFGDHTEMYERLQTIEFTSERKRMSVILRDKDGKIWLFCKGAESAVFPLCTNSIMVEDTNNDINVFANKGLRTLAVAYRQISDEEYNSITQAIKQLEGRTASGLERAARQFAGLERALTLVGATGVEDCLQEHVADTLAALRRAHLKLWVLTGDKVETAINVAQSCAHISENDRRMFLIDVMDETALLAHLQECRRIVNEPSYRDLTLVVDGASMAQVLESPHAMQFADLSLQCNAVLCCRLSPLQKAKIVKLIKSHKSRPVTAAIGDGANDISMIQEAHVGFGIFGKEGHQAARCADFAFTKFCMVKKFLLVLGHWYYQRLATLIHYFFYKNLILGNVMLAFQLQSAFSTQSVFDSMYLTTFNLLFTSVPCLFLAVTDQCWHKDVLLRNPILYHKISRNKLMTWRYFGGWFASSLYHTLIIYLFVYWTFRYSVISGEKNLDLWCYGAMLFHSLLVVTAAKLWLAARYQTAWFLASLAGSLLLYVALNALYSLLYFQIDGDVLGTYTRLLASPAFWFMNAVLVVASLWPDYVIRLYTDMRARRHLSDSPPDLVFSTHL